MNKEFQELKEEYQEAKNEQNMQKQRDCLKKMSKNIEKRGGSAEISCYEVELDRIEVELDRIYEKLLAIDGDMNRKDSVNLMTKIADSEREKQSSPNIYGPNNQYPQSMGESPSTNGNQQHKQNSSNE